MDVHVLTFEVGLVTGRKELIGVFDTEEKAEKALEKHSKKYCYNRRHYLITEIELNKEVNITFSEW